jgi:hypothetical protein
MSTFLTTGALKEDVVAITSSASSLALNPFSPSIIHVIGAATQLITLPDATKLVAGVHYVVINDSVGTVTIEDFTTATLVTLETGYFATLYLLNDSTTAGVWATASLNSVAADKNLKLIGGEIWSWDLATDTLSSSSYAYVVVPGLSPTDNAIASGSFVIPAGEVAYVALSGLSGGPDLTVQVTLPTAIPTGSNILIIAYRDGDAIIVGNSSFKLIDGQSGYLDLGLSIETQSLLGTLVTSATSTPDWLSRGAPTRTIPDTNSGILEAVASIDTEFDKYFGQLRIIPHATFADNIDVTGSDRLALTGEILSQELGSRVLDFSGATVDFTTGIISTGLNFTPATIPAGEYLWYCLILEYTGTNALGQSTARMQVRAAAASHASSLLAPYPKFPALFRSRPLGMVQVYNDAGTITVYQLRQLGVGGGSGGGSGGGGIAVRAADFTTAVLPTGAGPLIVDGITIDNEDMILYGNAALNRIYKVTGIGVSLLFEEVGVFSNGNVAPQDGDQVSAADGDVNDVTWEWDEDTTTWTYISLSTENKQWLGLTAPDKSGGTWQFQLSLLGQTNNVLVEGDAIEEAMKRLDIRPDVLKRVRALDLTSITLPAGPTVTVDGIVLVDGDKILFGSAALLGIYQVTGIGGTVVWTKLDEFGGSPTPSAHDAVLVREGTDVNCTIWLYDSALTPPWHRVAGPASTSWTGATPYSAPTWDGTLNSADTTVKLALDTIDKYFRGLQLRQHATDPNRVTILASNTTKTDLTTLNFTIADRLMSFAGAEIDFEAGNIYAANGITVIGTFVPYTIPQDDYFWYGVGFDAPAVGGDNSITPTITITFSPSTGLTPSAAAKPEFTARYTLGAVVVKGDTGGVGVTPITQDAIVYLGQFTGFTDLEATVAQNTIDISILQAYVSTMPQEERFLVGPGGQSIFNLTLFTVDPSNAVLDVDFILDGRWQTRSVIGDFSDGGVRKNSSTQVETSEVIPEGKEFVVIRRTMAGGYPLVDLTAITVDLGFVTPHTVGTLARPAWSFILKDKVTADIWELEVRNGVFQVVKIN